MCGDFLKKPGLNGWAFTHDSWKKVIKQLYKTKHKYKTPNQKVAAKRSNKEVFQKRIGPSGTVILMVFVKTGVRDRVEVRALFWVLLDDLVDLGCLFGAHWILKGPPQSIVFEENIENGGPRNV